MLTRLIVAGALAVLSSSLCGQTWTKHIAGGSYWASPIQVHDGGFGLTRMLGGDLAHGEFDANGNLLTSFELSPQGSFLSLSDADRLDDGSLLMIGQHDDKPWVTSVDPATGATNWDQTLSSQHGTLRCWCRNAIGHIVVAGFGQVPGVQNWRPYLAALSPTGGVLYRRFFGNDVVGEYIQAIVPVAGGGMIAVVMTSPSSTSSTEVRLLWLNDSGHLQFGRRISSSEGGLVSTRAVGTADGGVAIVGAFSGSGNNDNFFAMRFDATGTVVWQKAYDTYGYGTSSPRAVHGVVAHPDGGFAIAAKQYRPPTGSNLGHEAIALLRIDDNGEMMWTRYYGSPDHQEAATGIAVTSDGGFLLAGGDWSGPHLGVYRLRSDGTSEHCPSALDQPTASDTDHTIQYDWITVQNDPGMILDYNAVLGTGPTTITDVCGQDCEVVGATYGTGVAGTGGVAPTLEAVTGACLGWTPEVRIANGLPFAVGILGFSTAPANWPIFGGTSYLDIASFTAVTVFLDANGETVFPLAFDWSPFPGASLYAQGMLLDPGAAFDWSLTNAGSLTVQ